MTTFCVSRGQGKKNSGKLRSSRHPSRIPLTYVSGVDLLGNERL